MRGPLKWHGGKAYLAKRIVKLMPPHLHYVEPFAGGLSVLLEKDPKGVSEVVNDRNRDLVNFWRVLQDENQFARFVRRAQAMPFSKEEYELAEARLNDPQVEQCPVRWALSFFIVCRQSLAGRMDAFSPLTRNRVRRGMNGEVSAWLSTVEGLPAVHARLKRVVIVGPTKALKVIRQQDGEKTLFYLDPPYLFETRSTTGEYQHEMTDSDHAALLNVLDGIKGKFMLSGYRSDLYDAAALRNGWTRHDFDLPNNAASGKSKQRKTECLWCNF